MAKNSNKFQNNTKKDNNFKRLAENRYAKFQYEISETIEAGIELLGTEVKSIRNGKANLREFIGQEKLKSSLRIAIDASIYRKEPL